jgi:hypothetical protein
MNRTVAPVVGAAIVIGVAIFAIRDRAPSQPSAPVQSAPSVTTSAAPDAKDLPATADRIEGLVDRLSAPAAPPAPKTFSGAARAVRPVATEATEPECFVPWTSNPTPPGVTAWRLQTNLETQTIATSVGVESQTVLRSRCTTDGSTYISVTALPSGVKEVVFGKPFTVGGAQ